MITPAYASTMARYNAYMNAEIYAAAARLDDPARRAARGAFWESIHGTLSHLMWADGMWMSRFTAWEKPACPMKESPAYMPDFDAMRAARSDLDARLQDWASALDPDWLAADQTWFSGSIQQDVTQPRALLVAHMFNHQTHHRGQAHAMITAAGERTGDTDLWLLG